MQLANITQQANTWHLSGDMVVNNITQVLNASKALTISDRLDLDFAGVTDVDTSTISLIFEIQRRAAAQKALVDVLNIPSNLLSLMQLYGVDEFIVKK